METDRNTSEQPARFADRLHYIKVGTGTKIHWQPSGQGSARCGHGKGGHVSVLTTDDAIEFSAHLCESCFSKNQRGLIAAGE